MTYTLYTKEK